MDVKLVRLVTGEDLLSDVEFLSNGNIKLKNPEVLVPTEEGLRLVKYPFVLKVVDDNVVMDKRHILYILTPNDEAINTYKSKHGGLVVPPQQKLVGV